MKNIVNFIRGGGFSQGVRQNFKFGKGFLKMGKIYRKNLKNEGNFYETG